jgi:O-antigen ligase
LIPSAFSIQAFDKFGTIKLVVFLMGSGILLFYFAVYTAVYTARVCSKQPMKLPLLIRVAVVIFLAVQAFQTFRLKNPLVGLFGNYGQSESLLVQTGFMVIFFTSLLFLNQDQPNEFKLSKVILISVFLVSIFGIGQFFMGDPITKTNVPRIKSFIGDPNSLGAFLVLTLPIMIAQFWSQPNRFRKTVLGFGIYIGIIALFFTFSRTAWIAFFIIGLITIFWGISHKLAADRIIRRNLIAILLLIGLGLFSGVILSHFQQREHADYNLTARVSSVIHGNDSGRSLLWSIAFQTFRHSPWIGYGLGSFIENFHRYQPVTAIHFWGLERNISQVHNEIFHYLATQGLLGAFSYLFLLFSLFWCGNFRDLLRRNLDLQNLAVWAAVLGYLFFTQFAYPLVHYTFMVWIYWGILIRNRLSTAKDKPKTSYHPVLIVILLMVFGSLSWFLTGIYRADVYYQKAFYQARRHQYAVSLTNYQKAIRLAPFQYQYQYRYALTLYRAGLYYRQQQPNPGLTSPYFVKAKNICRLLAKRNPDRYQLYLLLGLIAEDESAYHKANNYYRKALTLFPNNCQIEFRLAKTELQLGNKPAARHAYQTGSEINPDYMKEALQSENLTLKDFTP